MGKKLRKLIYSDKTTHYYYLCPGCGYEHAFSPDIHTFNGDVNNPTISPSLLHDNPQHHHTCHSYIKNGEIQFLGDCWHELKGQTVQLPDNPNPDYNYLDEYNG